MKTLLTLIILALSITCFGQAPKKDDGIIVTDNVRLIQLGLDRKIDLSKGEQFTEQEWQSYYKQMAPHVKMFFKRDSAHQKWVSNTLTPNLQPGDTVVSVEIKGNELLYKLKPKKK